MFSSSYSHRLWCIWELFSLFTFCNKELALERIEIVFLNDQNNSDELLTHLLDFDIDSAHCFDPNEEYKLRKIMYDIGIETLKSSLKILGQNLKKTE